MLLKVLTLRFGVLAEFAVPAARCRRARFDGTRKGERLRSPCHLVAERLQSDEVRPSNRPT